MSGVLTDDERSKVREMFLTCTPDGIHLALSLLATLEATAEDRAAILDHSLLLALVQSWNPAVWEAAIPALPPVRRDAFTALLLMRFITAHASSGGASQAVYGVWQWATRRFWRGTGIEELLISHNRGDPSSFDQDSPWLSLDFLAELDADIVEEIADFKGDVHLNGLRNLTAEQADTLSRHAGWLYANALVAVPDPVADHLSRHAAHVFLEGLTTLTHVGLARKLAAKPVVFLESLVSATDAVVDALRRSGSRVFASRVGISPQPIRLQ